MLRWVGLVVTVAACSFHTSDGEVTPPIVDAAVPDGTAPAGRCAPLPPPSSPVAVSDVVGLRAALAAATPGTTITLGDGHYDVSAAGLVITVPNLTLRSASDDATRVVIAGGSGGAIIASASDVTVASLTIGGADFGMIVTPTVTGDIARVTIYDVTFAGDRAGIRITPFAPIVGPFADAGTVACSRFIGDGISTCSAGTLGIAGEAARGWTVRDSRFQGLACATGFRRTVVFFEGSRDTQILGNVFVGGSGNIMLGQDITNLARSYADGPTCGGTPEHRGGVICNNAITGLDAPPIGGEDFQEGIALWNACDATVIHNTVVSPAGETFTNLEYRYADTIAHLVNNLTEVLPAARDGATADYLTSDAVYAAETDFVDPHGDLHLSASATEPAGASIAALGVCATDADGKPRDLAQPTLGAYER